MSAADLSLRHLAALVAIHEEGSYRRAADRLGYSQAAVTSQVAALEKAVGAKVFDRPGGPRPVTLTAAGQEVLDVAREVLAAADVLDLRLASLRDGRWGRLAIGTFQSVSAQLLPGILRTVRRESPQVQVNVLESDDNDVLTGALRAARLDVSFLVGPVDETGLVVREVVRDPFVAMVPADDPAGEVLPVDDLATRPLVGHDHCVCHELAEQGLAAAGIRPSFAFRSNDNAAVQAMVRAGIGTAVMPALSVNTDDPGVRVVRLEPALPSRSILLAHAARRPAPTAVAFVARALEQAAALNLERFG
ncbi:MAG TPA: LysR family transcriptional regulator [Segeticoccus sp.]|uniref:LysR family transcriptional regulator n=1 Tax=Segeticoccus sp. TaxID=2706531 RepID=UPI002D806835|nr:LysR family transcriptional regulator [Segeticoccus sp.]HET8599663.1 LysR family transcriptional regulator [Segeticoccus sp.]